MRTLTKEEFTLLKELFEEVHGGALVEIGFRDVGLGGYYTGASSLYCFLESKFRFGDSFPKTIEEFHEELRIPTRNNCVDNAQSILKNTRRALLAPIEELPKTATSIEKNIWSECDAMGFVRFTILAALQTEKLPSVPDCAIVARWRLAIGI